MNRGRSSDLLKEWGTQGLREGKAMDRIRKAEPEGLKNGVGGFEVVAFRNSEVMEPDTLVSDPVEWQLRLYIAGKTPRSLQAFTNLKALCQKHLSGNFWIEVIDLHENPHLAKTDGIVAIPTLVRRFPFANPQGPRRPLRRRPCACGVTTMPAIPLIVGPSFL